MTQPPAGYPPPEGYQPPSEYEIPARHRPGYQPPTEYEIPARQQPPADYGPPVSGPPRPPYGPPPPGAHQPPYGAHQPPYGPPPGGTQQPPYGSPPPAGPPRRRALPLLIIAAVAGLLVLCGGGGLGAWLLLRDTDRDGAASPTAAVQAFLEAVYHDHDPERAAGLVCSEARDQDALAAKINEIAAYEGTQVDPRFRWSEPAVIEQTDEVTVVAVTITMITGDERLADQLMHVSVLDKQPHGWWVCNLETVSPTTDEGSEESEDSEQSEQGADGEDGTDGESGGGDG